MAEPDDIRLFAPMNKDDLAVHQCPNAGSKRCIYWVSDGEGNCLICGPNAPRGTAQIMHRFAGMYGGMCHQALGLAGME